MSSGKPEELMVYRTIFETTGNGTFIVEGDLTITHVNEEFCRQTGYERQEIEGSMKATDFVLPEYLRKIEEYRILRQTDPGKVPSSYELKVKHRDGSVHDGIITVRMVPGTERRVISFLDITDRKRMEDNLRESESKYRTIFETTGALTFIYGDDLVIQLVNPEFVKRTGYSREEVEGRMTALDLLCPECQPLMAEYHSRRSPDPDSIPTSHETKIRDRGGTTHEGILRISMIPDTSLRVGSFIDNTEIKRAEQQMYRAEKMAALGQLIAGVAHEINNPNNFIHFNLPVLRKYIEAMRDALDEASDGRTDIKIMNMPCADFMKDLFGLLDNMAHGSSRITEIVNDLRDHVMIDREESMESMPIGVVVDRVKTLVGKQVQKTVKRLEYDIEPDLPPIMMYPGRIEQVLINLIINAAQASDKADSWIRLVARRGSDGRSIEVLVSDNGCGINPAATGKIFDPFYTTKDREVGTGLGLWICHRIVEDHCGSISVASVPGVETTFTVVLPWVEREC